MSTVGAGFSGFSTGFSTGFSIGFSIGFSTGLFIGGERTTARGRAEQFVVRKRGELGRGDYELRDQEPLQRPGASTLSGWSGAPHGRGMENRWQRRGIAGGWYG